MNTGNHKTVTIWIMGLIIVGLFTCLIASWSYSSNRNSAHAVKVAEAAEKRAIGNSESIRAITTNGKNMDNRLSRIECKVDDIYKIVYELKDN